jgi:hypothetical protein
LPAQSFSGTSPIFYSLRFETSLFVASYDSQGHGGGIRPRLQTGITAARRVFSLHNFGADPTENAVSNSFSIVMGGCLATDWILFPRERVYGPLLRKGCLSARCIATVVLVCFEASARLRVCTPQYQCITKLLHEFFSACLDDSIFIGSGFQKASTTVSKHLAMNGYCGVKLETQAYP